MTGETRTIGDARVSFHPAGHVPGSAQIRVEHKGEVWVASGDYKTVDDGLSEPFEPVRCHTFITECTFGLPVFRWRPQAEVMAEVGAWWHETAATGKVAMLGAYSLGKAQRLLAALPEGPGPVLTHGAVEGVTQVLRDAGLALPSGTYLARIVAGAEVHSRKMMLLKISSRGPRKVKCELRGRSVEAKRLATYTAQVQSERPKTLMTRPGLRPKSTRKPRPRTFSKRRSRPRADRVKMPAPIMVPSPMAIPSFKPSSRRR